MNLKEYASDWWWSALGLFVTGVEKSYVHMFRKFYPVVKKIARHIHFGANKDLISEQIAA